MTTFDVRKHRFRWPGTITSVALAGAALVLQAPASNAHGAKSETYTAEAPAPFPSLTGCTGGQEGASKESHPFQRPVSGMLTVEMTEFTGDWDLYLLNAQGGRIASSTGGQPPDPAIENLSALLGANDAVTIVACNWSGGPTAKVSFNFARAAFVSVGDVTVHEGDAGTRNAVFSVSLSEPSQSTVTVNYATTNGSAAEPGDFSARSGTLSFLPGSTNATVKVPVSGDSADEGDESFSLALSSPTGAVVADGTGVGVIVDDDPATTTGRLAIGDVTVHEGDSGARAAVFTVSLSEPSGSPVAVSFATGGKGGATGADFTGRTGTLSFAPGTTSINVKVAITPDNLAEINESFAVNLTGASGATIADTQGVGTIVNDD